MMINHKEQLKIRWLFTVSFLSGMCIMGIQLTSSRLLAPYYGTSTYIWTNVIGVMMIALSLGYYYGGKVADKTHDEKILYRALIIGGIFSALTPFLIKPLTLILDQSLILFNSAVVSIFVGSMLTMLMLFFIPIFLFAFVSPYVITLVSDITGHSGNVPGKVFAISTIGSTLGTFSPVLILIPFFGTQKTIVIFSLIIVFLGVIGSASKNIHKLLATALLVLIFIPSVKHPAFGQLVAEEESAYQYMRVVDEGNLRYLLINEGRSVYSIKSLDDILTGSYFDYYALLPSLFNDNDLDILLLGLAGGTIANQIIDLYPERNIEIDGIEIDAKMIEVGKKYFEMERENLNIINADGRIYLDRVDNNYDLIIIDTYANQLYISFQLTTLEFFQTTKKRLNSGGVVAFNVNAISEDSKLLQSIVKTMEQVFTNVWVAKTGDRLNYMVLASDADLDFQQAQSQLLPDLQVYGESLAAMHKLNTSKSAKILTDDLAPIEHLTDFMILEYLFKN